jgi:hypothetical protein
MLEARVKQLQNQARSDFSYNKSLNERLVPFLKKEVTEKEEDDDEEDQQAWPSGNNDDNGPVSPIRYPRVKRWFKCPFASAICISTRTVYSATSKTSSWKNHRRMKWSNIIASLIGCMKQQ